MKHSIGTITWDLLYSDSESLLYSLPSERHNGGGPLHVAAGGDADLGEAIRLDALDVIEQERHGLMEGLASLSWPSGLGRLGQGPGGTKNKLVFMMR